MSRLKAFLPKSLYILRTGRHPPFPYIDTRNLLIQPSSDLHWRTSVRFFDIYQMFDKAAIRKERARINDEINKGYFADIGDFQKNGGKISMASKILIPAAEAVQFPSIKVICSDGTLTKLPIEADGLPNIPKVSLLCLSFRAISQEMVDSWSTPFRNAFGSSNNTHIFEVSLIDSWALSLRPVRWMLLRVMRRSDSMNRRVVYAFGDHYWFRKELKILNLLSGYIFLLDRFGRIRWKGCGMATNEELTSLLSFTSALLEEH